MIESLDRPALADALDRAAQTEGRLPDLLVEVNTGDEPQKFGVPREQADALIRACRQRFGEKLRGLMCIPPRMKTPARIFGCCAPWRTRTGFRCCPWACPPILNRP